MVNHLIEELGGRRHWVCWQKESAGKEGRVTKIPYIADARRKRASTTRGEDWRDYSEAQRAIESGNYDGVGFVLSLDLPYICVDIDHCLDPKTGEVTEGAADILALVGGTYTEISPSGDGLHIWGRGALPKGKDGKERAGIRGGNNTMIEIYRGSRYMTVTSTPLVNEPIRDIQPAIDEILQRLEATREKKTDRAIRKRPPEFESSEFSDGFIIHKLRNSPKQGEKFKSLFDRGDLTEYEGDQSRADCALLSMLAWWTDGNATQMKRIFMKSKLAETLSRKKHHEEDYLARTIDNVLEHWRDSGGGSYWPQRGIAIKQEFSAGGDTTRIIDSTSFSDREMARLVKEKYGGVIGYCDGVRKWMQYEGGKWKQTDEEAIYSYVWDVLDSVKSSLCVELAEAPRSSKRSKEITTLLNIIDRGYSSKKAHDVLKAVKGICRFNIEDFDRDPYKLNCPNGLLDLVTGELAHHDPEQLNTKITGAAYTGRYNSSLWLDTVESIFPNKDTREYVQKALGYAISGGVDPAKFFILYGSGGNGKGVIMETVNRTLRDYFITFKSSLLLSKSDYADADRPTAVSMAFRGARIARCSETGAGRRLSVAAMKSLTGGDTISGRPPYGDKLINFFPTHKMFMETNDLPVLPPHIETSITRRLVVIPFKVTFSSQNGNYKTNLKEELSKKENLEDVLTWLVDGYKKFRQDAEPLPMPREVITATSEYYNDFDIVGAFIREQCDIRPENHIKRAELYEAFERFCFDEWDDVPRKKREFFEDIRKIEGVGERTVKGKREFTGIGLIEQ